MMLKVNTTLWWIACEKSTEEKIRLKTGSNCWMENVTLRCIHNLHTSPTLVRKDLFKQVEMNEGRNMHWKL
jgi:hypothetical protein